MDPEYTDYFSRRNEELSVGRRTVGPMLAAYSDDPDVREVANDAIDAAKREIPPGVDLRPDAELVLYLLTSELVTRPVLSLRPNERPELADAVAADAATIARAAVANLQTDQEVSAHGVIDALSQNWQNLQVARWRLWDRYSD